MTTNELDFGSTARMSIEPMFGSVLLPVVPLCILVDLQLSCENRIEVADDEVLQVLLKDKGIGVFKRVRFFRREMTAELLLR